MQLQDFVPDIASQDAALTKSNKLLEGIYEKGFNKYLQKTYGGDKEVQSAQEFYGIEQLYFDWLRTAYAYRRMFIQDLYLLAMDSAEIRAPLLQIKGAVFRKGFDEWQPKWSVKCKNCGKIHKEKVEKCDCDSDDFIKPDSDQYKKFDDFRINCNIFGQSLEEVLQMVSDDLNIVDDGFIFLNKQYISVSNKLYGRLIEIRRLHPALMEYDLNKEGLPKSSHWICPFHREKTSVKPGICPICGFQLAPAMYVYNHRGKRIYLFEDEIIHLSKFSPSETYGYSPLLTIMQKVLTLSGMDRFLYRYFFERKTPTGMIITYTDDPQSLEQERARMESKLREDPTYMPWIAVSQRTNRGKTDFVRLWHTLHEMDYLPVRNEIRDRVAMIYGVPQMYMNVFEGVGGLSGQTQQLKVFNDIIEAEQRRYNEKVFPILLEAFGITDWEITLRPPEGKVEAVMIQLSQQRIAIAGQMQAMGFDVSLKPDHENITNLDFVFSTKPQPQMDPMAIMGEEGAVDENGNPVDESGRAEFPEGTHEEEDGRPLHSKNERHDVNPIENLEEQVFQERPEKETNLWED